MENYPDDFTKKMAGNALHCVEHFSDRFGKELDFSEKSLETIDVILGEAHDFYDEIGEEQKKWIVHVVGSYIFEVARKNFGGKYFWYDAGNQPIFVTGQPDFEIAIIVFDKVQGRMENGSEDNIPYFFKGYSERVRSAKKGERVTIV